MTQPTNTSIRRGMARGKRSTRDNFEPELILGDLAAGGRIRGEEAKRLLEEGCHAYIRLKEKLRIANAHAGAIFKATESV